MDVTQPKAPNLQPNAAELERPEGKGKQAGEPAGTTLLGESEQAGDGFTLFQKLLFVGLIMGVCVAYLRTRRRTTQFQKSRSMA